MNKEVLQQDTTHHAELWAAEDEELALPWAKRTGWRQRPLYRGWIEEELLEAVGNDRAAITRSHSGYRVLNTPDLGFIDIDFNFDYPTSPQEKESLAQLRDWSQRNPDLTWRAYRTAGGLRLMRTDACQPLTDEFDAICKAVSADDYYRQLCQEQNMFRARLTPKPLRCGIMMPPWNPFDRGWSEYDRKRIPDIMRAYDIASAAYKTCELIEVIGSGIVHPDLRDVVRLHDSACQVFAALPMEAPHQSEIAGPRLIDVLNFHRQYRGETSNGSFRPSHHTPDRIWAVLSDEVQRALKDLDNCDEASYRQLQDEDARQEYLAAKWCALPRGFEAHFGVDALLCK